MSDTMEDIKAQEKPRTEDIKITECIDFSALMLSEPVLAGLKEAGFERPSPIQLKAIPLGRCGLDLVVQAKSGTGKTCVFSVVALESINVDVYNTQVLILAPTREIAVQIWEVISTLGSSMPALRCYTFIGGMPLNDDKTKLKKCHIAVGTPGRVKQLIEHQALNTESIRLFILDEADKLLEEGFQETINWIYSSLPENKQLLALSATYPEALAKHITAYMRDPTFVRLNTLDPALLGIRQFYKEVPFHPLPQKSFETRCQELMYLLTSVAFQQCLVFSNYQLRAQSLSDVLNSKGWPAAYISGSQDQRDRLTAMAKLKKFKCRILISTDLTSRGIDAENVNLVVNMDIPYDHDTYLHRIGRAGRFGTYGAAVTFVSLGKEMAELKSMEKKANTRIHILPDPIPSDLTRSSGYVDLDDYVTTEQHSGPDSQSSRVQASNQKSSNVQEPVTVGPTSDESTELEPRSTSNTQHEQRNGDGAAESKMDAEDVNGVEDPSSDKGFMYLVTENGTQGSGSIPELIDSISENVQIGYQEAETLLEADPEVADPEVGSVENVPTQSGIDPEVPSQKDAHCRSSLILPPVFKRALTNEPQQDKMESETKMDCVSSKETTLSSEVTAEDSNTETNSTKESGENCSDDTLSQVLRANIRKDATKMKPLDLNPSTVVDLSQWKPVVRTSLSEIIGDLKHFRDTGKNVQRESPNHYIWRDIADCTKDFMQDTLPCVEQFLKDLHLDPSKEDVSDRPLDSVNFGSTQPEHRESATITVRSEKVDSSVNQLTEKQTGQTSSTADSADFVTKDRLQQNHQGARPKEYGNKSHSSQKHKVNSQNTASKEKPKRPPNITDEDRLLGLEYMKKLTACTDKDLTDGSETTQESDTTETEYTTSDDEDYEDQWEDEEDNEADWEDQEEYEETDAAAEAEYYSSQQNFTDYYANQTKGQDYSHSEFQNETNYHNTDYCGFAEQGNASSNQYGSHHDTSFVPNFPQQLWSQCSQVMNSMCALQASQYAWWCQQQYQLHSFYARQYHSMYTNLKQTKQMQRDLKRLKAQMANLYSRNESQL